MIRRDAGSGRPRPGRRLAAALLAGLFLLAGSADVYGLHQCPHHQPTGTRQADSDGSLCAPSSSHRLPHLHPGTDGTPGEDAGPCTCVGNCHGSASTPVVSERPLQPRDAGFRVERWSVPPTAAAPSRDPAAYLVPYPNGPPHSG